MTILEAVGSDDGNGGDEGSCQSVVNEMSLMRDEHEVKAGNDIPVYKASKREVKPFFPRKIPGVKAGQNQDLHVENTYQQNFREFLFK